MFQILLDNNDNLLGKQKGTAIDQENTLAKHVSDKRPILQNIFLKLLKFNNKTNNPIKGWQEILTDTSQKLQNS